MHQQFYYTVEGYQEKNAVSEQPAITQTHHHMVIRGLSLITILSSE